MNGNLMNAVGWVSGSYVEGGKFMSVDAAKSSFPVRNSSSLGSGSDPQLGPMGGEPHNKNPRISSWFRLFAVSLSDLQKLRL